MFKKTLQKMTEKIKLIIVGDGNCGKTLMLSVFQNNGVIETEHSPTVFETYVHTCQVDEVPVELELCDTAGQEQYDRLRLIAYKRASVVVVVYSIAEPASLHNVANWKKEVRSQLPTCPIILVGNKSDLREDQRTRETLMRRNLEPATEASGRAMKDNIGASAFLECSALHNIGIQEVFETAVRVTLKPKVKPKRGFFDICVVT